MVNSEDRVLHTTPAQVDKRPFLATILPMPQRRLVFFLTASTLLLVLLIVSDGLPHLRGPAPDTAEWHWPYRLQPFSTWWLPLLAAFFIWLSGSWWLGNSKKYSVFSIQLGERGRTVMGLLALAGGSLWLQLSLIYVRRGQVWAELIDRTLSDVSSGYFRAAVEIENLAATLRHYPAIMPTFTAEHAQTHPPGLIMANRLTVEALAHWPGLSHWLAASVWPARCTDLWLLNQPPAVAAGLGLWAIFPLLAAALTPLPAYGLARHLLLPQAARLAAILTATIPALLLFAPTPVQFYPFLALSILWLVQRGIQCAVSSGQYSVSKWSFVYLGAAGCLLSLASFLSLGNGALALLITLYVAFWVWQKGLDWRQGLAWLVIIGLSSLSLWAVYWLFTAVPPWQIMQVGLQQHYDLVTFHRRYEWWLVWNLIDLLLFAGWPLFILFVAGTILTIRKIWAKTETAVSYQARPHILPLTLFCFIFILNLSGSARGEVGRLWAFVMPFMALISAAYLAQQNGKRLGSLIVALQLLLVVALGMAWQPMEAVIVVAERPSMAPIPANLQPISAAWAETIRLQGYAVAQTDESIRLTYVWQAAGPTLRPYTVFTHLVNDAGELVAQQDQWPVDGRWPPTCWQPGDTIVDKYEITLPPTLPPGRYTLWLGLYDAQDNSRLPLSSGQEALQIQVIER
jgi:hypothetical protein